MGRDWETRGTRFNETLDVMVSLFNDEVTQYSGRVLQVPPVGMIPKPQTRPHPPFVFGGHAPAALARAARRGNGWLASELSSAEMTVAVATLGRLRVECGRGDVPFEVSCSVTGELGADEVRRYAEAGVDRLVVRPWIRGRDAVPNLRTMAARLGPFT